MFDLLKKIFQKSNPKKGNSKFFAGYELPTRDMEGFYSIHEIDKQQLYLVKDYFEFKYDESNLLEQVYHFSKENVNDNKCTKTKVNEADFLKGKLEFNLNLQHRIIDLVKNKKGGRRGYHQIGGKKPSDFVIPRTKDIGDFQYLGFLSNEDPTFNWLGLEFHLVCPIYLNFQRLYLDYSNFLNPTIINIEEIQNSDTSFDFLNSSFFINFKEYNCHFEGAVNYGYGMAHSGIPEWIQYPYFPRCPKTNKILRFVCQLKSSGGVMVEETNAVFKDKHYKSYFNKLNFWGDGDLFVFFEPESKVACYFIQNT